MVTIFRSCFGINKVLEGKPLVCERYANSLTSISWTSKFSTGLVKKVTSLLLLVGINLHLFFSSNLNSPPFT